ncbi:MAG TPA: aromatic amino acid lyase, partial [Gemmatales bacterium]|nr:aromatic amino acid lyase [Gemmatales bacterium]
MSHLELRPGQLTWHMCQRILQESELQLSLQTDSYKLMEEAQKCVERVITEGRTVYGVNTGFGLLANTRIAPQELELLQRSIVLSHAAGVGAPLQNDSVRLILALKINSLGQGYSGVRREITDALLNLFNHGIYPVIPEKGSVGASGDLAPLAHLAAVLIGEGEAQYRGEVIHGNKALSFMGIQPITLAPKEGLALLNGTQVSTALAIQGLLATQDILRAALVAGAFSVEAAEGSRKPFDPRIQAVRRHPAQITVARLLCNLLAHSEIEAAHADCSKVQDPYSLRCQPQVMGACLAQLKYAAEILLEEANGVSDNPLIFAETNDILSGGNFHAEPVAF